LIVVNVSERDPSVSRQLARIPVLAAVLAAVVLLAPGHAAAATPCWKQIVNDWSADGAINKTYPVHCYREALANLPEDIRDYTSLGDDIQAALQVVASHAATRHLLGSGNRTLQDQRISSLGPSNASSIPLPLLILAGLAGLLLMAGSAGAVARRLEARRAPATARTRHRA
jgi:hypothetical protein